MRDHAEAVLDLLGLRDVAAIVGPAPTELPQLHRARVWLLEAFSARFQDLPAALREAVGRTSDLERLSRWHRGVVSAPDAGAAMAAVLREP